MKSKFVIGWIHILIIPFIEIVAYSYTGISDLNFVGYYAPILMVLLGFCSLFFYIDIALILVLILYSVAFEARNRSEHLGYIVSLLQFYFACTKLPNLIKALPRNDVTRSGLIFLNLGLLIAFALTSFDHREGGRDYKGCFIIPHQMAYYLAILSYVNIFFGAWWMGIPNIFAIAMIGTRVGLLLGGLAVIFSGIIYLAQYRVNRWNKYFLVFGCAAAVVSVGLIGENSELLTAYDAVLNSSLTFDLYDADTVKSSSHRALIATTSFEQALSDGLSAVNFFGRGPRWTMQFNEAELGVRIWSHNDILDLFMCGGLVLPMIYIYAMFRLFLDTKSVFIIIFILIAGFLNGFFFYSTPFIIGVFSTTVPNRVENVSEASN